MIQAPTVRLLHLAALLFAVPLAAQVPAALEAREHKALARIVERLDDFADECTVSGLHGRAFALRREILLEYDENDQRARSGLGYTRVGRGWARDPRRSVPTQDRVDRRAAAYIDREWRRVVKDIVAEHRRQARAMEGAGAHARAVWHHRRLRGALTLPCDGDAGLSRDPRPTASSLRQRGLRSASVARLRVPGTCSVPLTAGIPSRPDPPRSHFATPSLRLP